VPRTTIPWLPVAALAPDRFPAVEHLAISDVLITVIYDNRDSGAPKCSALASRTMPPSPRGIVWSAIASPLMCLERCDLLP
jgi:hypothetical protein